MRTRWGRLLVGMAAALVAGCGGANRLGPGGAGTGRATFTIVWPAPGKLIPAAANSIVVQILKGSVAQASQTLARPASGGAVTVSFGALPVGSFTATAAAHPSADGTGVTQAQASVPLTIQANQNTPFTITMASTIDHIDLAPPNAAVTVGKTLQLTATARDAAGEVVLTDPAKLQWSSSNPADASVDPATGLVTGVMAGSATITVLDSESGKSASELVTVSAPSGYTIGGITYVPSTPQETLTATFTQPDGGVTTSSYSGYVLVDVTGTGQAYGTVHNDAFWLYDGPFNPPVNGWDGGYYQLAFGTTTLQDFDAGNDAKNFLAGPLPPYTVSHEYTVILNTGLTTPRTLHFGVSDGGFNDNTGAYTIKITQLVPQ